MPSTKKTRCWFELGGKTYGPAECEITEDIDASPHGTTRIRWYGAFVQEAGAVPLPFMSAGGKVVLEDGRRGDIHFEGLLNGVQGTFRVDGDLEQAS